MSELNKDSKMECARHGLRRPAFICQHLLHEENLSFYESDEAPDLEWPFKSAWCAKCEAVAIE